MISLIVTEIPQGVGIRRGSVIGDFPLSIFILNICSFNKNINLLTEYLSCIKNKYNIILLIETWLKSLYNPSIYFPTYNVFQLNRLCKKNKRGGGVLALVDKHLEASIV